MIIETSVWARTRSTSSGRRTSRSSCWFQGPRRGAGAQGRDHGDRGHLRGEQGRSRGRRSSAQSVSACCRCRHFSPRLGRPPIQKTEATTGTGIAELLETIQQFRAHSADARASRQRVRQEFRLRDLLSHRFMQLVDETPACRRAAARRGWHRLARSRSLFGGRRDHAPRRRPDGGLDRRHAGLGAPSRRHTES